MSMTPERIEEKKQIAVTVSRMPEEKINDLYDKICELAHAEDGEQLEDILSEFNLMNVGYDAAWDEVERLLAALEESLQQRDIDHANYKTYYAEAIEVSKRLAEAQQTISRQRKALERILNCTGIGYESAWRTSVLIAKEAIGGNKEGSDKA